MDAAIEKAMREIREALEGLAMAKKNRDAALERLIDAREVIRRSEDPQEKAKAHGG
jgi:hypothetical protein